MIYRLLFFELRKNFIRKYLIIAVLVLFIINVYFIYNQCVSGLDNTGYFMPHTRQTQARWDFYKAMHKKLDGKLTTAKARYVVEENKRVASIISDDTYSKDYQANTYTGYFWSDYVMVNKYFYVPMKYLSTYNVNNEEIVKQAQANIIFYDKYGNPYEKAKNQFIAVNYTNRSIGLFYDTKPWEVLFEYNFSDLIILLLIILGLVPVFTSEKEANMQGLILSTRQGKKYVNAAKVLSSIAYVIFLVSIFSVFNLLLFKLLYGLNGAELPVYAIEKYQHTPLGYSLGTFYFVTQLLKTTGLISFGMFILLLSSLCKRVVYPYLISALTMVGGLYAAGFNGSVETGKAVLAFISPFTLLKGNELYEKLLGIDFLQKFILRAHICLVVQGLSACVLCLIICLGLVRRNAFISGFKFILRQGVAK